MMGIRTGWAWSNRMVSATKYQVLRLVSQYTFSLHHFQQEAWIQHLNKTPASESRLGIVTIKNSGLTRYGHCWYTDIHWRFSEGKCLRSTAVSLVETDHHSWHVTILTGSVCSHCDPALRSNIPLELASHSIFSFSPSIPTDIKGYSHREWWKRPG